MVGLALWSEPFRLEVREIFRGITEQITAEVFTDELMAELGYVHNPETLASLFFWRPVWHRPTGPAGAGKRGDFRLFKCLGCSF